MQAKEVHFSEWVSIEDVDKISQIVLLRKMEKFYEKSMNLNCVLNTWSGMLQVVWMGIHDKSKDSIKYQ